MDHEYINIAEIKFKNFYSGVILGAKHFFCTPQFKMLIYVKLTRNRLFVCLFFVCFVLFCFVLFLFCFVFCFLFCFLFFVFVFFVFVFNQNKRNYYLDNYKIQTINITALNCNSRKTLNVGYHGQMTPPY